MQHHVGKVSPEPLTPPVEKETKGGQPAFSSFVSLFIATFTMISHHRDYRGIQEAQSLGIWLWQRRGVGFATTSTWGLANAQVVIPNQQLCSSAEQSQGYTLDMKLGECTPLTDLSSQIRSFADLRAQFAHTRVGCRVTALPAMESAFKLDLTRRASDNSWKVCGQGALEQRGRRSRLLSSEQSQYWAWSHLMLCTGMGLIYSQSLGCLLASQPESLFGRLMVVSGWWEK